MKHPERVSDIKAGAFVLIALAILVTGSLWIAGSSFFGAARVPYRVWMQDSGGLQAGDRVRIAGVSVGRIQRLDLYTDRDPAVELVIGIRPDFRIHADGTAQVATTGLMGQAYLDIRPGSPGAPLLTAGEEIPGVATPGIEQTIEQVSDIATRASQVLDQASTLVDTVASGMGPLMANMNALLSEDNAQDVRQILTSLRATSDEVGPRVTALLARLDTISADFQGSVDGLPELTSRMSEVVDGLQQALGPDGERLAAVLDSAESGMSRAEDTLSIVGDNRAELEATLRDLRDVVSNLKAFSQQVKERPFSLVRIKAEPDRKPGDRVRAGAR